MFFFVFIYIFIAKFSFILSSTYEDVLSSLSELAYDYYMRGPKIQYADGRCAFFPPEDATQQFIKYTVCSHFVNNVYQELLNITIPRGPELLNNYAQYNIGRPEVILYSVPDIEKDIRTYYLYSKEDNNYIETTKFSLQELIPLIQPGDILSYTGHTKLIYDVERDSDGKVIDAFILESVFFLGSSYIKTKVALNGVTGPDGYVKDFAGFTLFLYSRRNNNYEEGLTEGTLRLIRLSEYGEWKKLYAVTTSRYSILRFINKDSKGNAVLNYKAWYKDIPHRYDNGDIINLTDKDIDRTKKFKRLYIEKLVNKINRNTVVLGDILNYKIIIKNMWKNDYNYDIVVTENISEFVTYESHFENKSLISFNYDKNKRQLIWNIGKLKKNETFIINYLVRVTSGKKGDIIENSGLVANIPSSSIQNYIGTNLNKNQMEKIKINFEKLKNKYTGKKLINEIYKMSLNKDIKFDKFNITQLINNMDENSFYIESLILNKNHSYYRAILNKYWSSMVNRTYLYDKNKEEAVVNAIKYFGQYNDPERRKDFIFKEDFKTGDILLYINTKDFIYSYDENKNIVKNYITYEDGEYAYIYIEGKGFVGTNLGNDGIKNTADDRNEFNARYYNDNNLVLYANIKNPTEELLEMANLQTLLGKNYYVILRPSLCFYFPDINNNNKILVFVIIFFILLIIAFGLLILWKYINMKKNGKEFNLNNLKNELLFTHKINQ